MIYLFSRRIRISDRCALLVLGVVALVSIPLFSTQAAPTRQAAFLQSAARQPNVLYTFALPHSESAVVYKSGVAKIYTADFSAVETRMIAGLVGRAQSAGALGASIKAKVRFELSNPVHHHPYASHEVLVVYNGGVHGTRSVVNVPMAKVKAMRKIKSLTGSVAPSQAPKYTTSGKLNALLARLGVDRSTRLFRNIPSGRLQAMAEQASTASGHPMLNIGNAYKLHVTNASVPKAVAALRRLGAVSYASPAYYVSTMHTRPIPIPRSKVGHSMKPNTNTQFTPATGTAGGSDLPSNYGLQSSLQSAFNAPSLNARPPMTRLSGNLANCRARAKPSPMCRWETWTMRARRAIRMTLAEGMFPCTVRRQLSRAVSAI